MPPLQSRNLKYHDYETPKDDSFFHTLISDPKVFANVSYFNDRHRCDQIRNRLVNGNALLFMIITLPAAKSIKIGALSLKSAHYEMIRNGCAGFGIDMVPGYQKYKAEAITWALNWAFRTARLHRVELTLPIFDEEDIDLFDQMGFVIEGRKRDCLWYNGRWWDGVVMGKLANEEESSGFNIDPSIMMHIWS